MKEVFQEMIEFFEYKYNWDKEELLSEVLSEIPEFQWYQTDEVELKYNEEYLMDLDTFTNKFYDIIEEKICNVLKSFRDEVS